MTKGHKCAFENFNYSLNVSKLLDVNDDSLNLLLEKYEISRTRLDEMVQSIRDWYEKQPHLPQGQLHDRMIVGQLISRGFSVEQSKEKIDNYYSSRHKMPEILCDRNPTTQLLDKYLKEGYWLVSPLRIKENYRIVILRIISPEATIMSEVMKLGIMLSDIRLMNDTSDGDHWILDFSNMCLHHALQFTPLLLSNLYHYVTSCYAPKIKGIHLVGVPSFGQSIVALAKKLMKDKHVQRTHMYNNFQEVYQVLPREIFPKDLGGDVDVTCQEIANMICEIAQSEPWKEFYRNQNKNFFTDESKRLNASKANDTFGLDGSFRKLDLD